MVQCGTRKVESGRRTPPHCCAYRALLIPTYMYCTVLYCISGQTGTRIEFPNEPNKSPRQKPSGNEPEVRAALIAGSIAGLQIARARTLPHCLTDAEGSSFRSLHYSCVCATRRGVAQHSLESTSKYMCTCMYVGWQNVLSIGLTGNQCSVPRSVRSSAQISTRSRSFSSKMERRESALSQSPIRKIGAPPHADSAAQYRLAGGWGVGNFGKTRREQNRANRRKSRRAAGSRGARICSYVRCVRFGGEVGVRRTERNGTEERAITYCSVL